jgi:Fic family protein
MFVKTKKINNEEYYYLIKSYRIDDKVYQKNLKYLGNVLPNKEELEDIKNEFTEKKIQKLIRSDLKFEPYKVDLEFLDKIEKLKRRFFKNLNSLGNASRSQLIKRFKTGYTYHSCSIEGNTLSRAEVDLVINKNQSIDGKKLLELQEVRNHNRAIDYMMSENFDLSEDFIKRIHEVLMKDVLEFVEFDEEFVIGGYRCDMRYIEGADFIPVNPIQLVYEMKDLVSFYKKNKYKIHPIELASEFHLRFAIIHPFSDGNGRMARLLMNFILERSGFPMIDISVENRSEYIKALDSGDSLNLTKFIYGQLEKYVDSLFSQMDVDEKVEVIT